MVGVVITFMGYDPEQQTMRIMFDGGEVYDYFLVKPDVARQAEVALADGDPLFFKRSIRGVYPNRRAH